MGRLIRSIYKFFKIVAPWLWRIAVFSIKTVFVSFGSWAVSIPKIVRVVARNWSDRAQVAGVPSEYDQVLFFGAGAVAVLMIIIGWVFSAYLTVWIVGLLI